MSKRKNTPADNFTSATVDHILFAKACEYVREMTPHSMGIGTLSEKTLHAICKYYYAPDPQYHEIPVGSFVADIMMDGEITEIQTRSFDRMRGKLEAFLLEHEVTIVHPIPHVKWISWIDPDTGEATAPRKSPKKGNLYQVIPELYKIKMFLPNEHLHFIFPLIDLEETKLLNGWSHDRKKGSWRNDRVPTKLYDEIRIDCLADYAKFLPEELPTEFTSADLAKAAHIPTGRASTLLGILHYIGTVTRIGKKGKAYLYCRKDLT